MVNERAIFVRVLKWFDRHPKEAEGPLAQTIIHLIEQWFDEQDEYEELTWCCPVHGYVKSPQCLDAP